MEVIQVPSVEEQFTPMHKIRTNYWTCANCLSAHNIATLVCPKCNTKAPIHVA